ncbi:ABC transporter permease [Pseudoalteromonas sp.]|uniref:ABC transporter permease n=1 Tax=Pseudoalteromonas sp. TaxID=53249 RepID=UPI0035614590
MLLISSLRALYTLKSETKRTYLSFVWWIVAPAIDIAVLYFVFSILLGGFSKTTNFAAVLSIGIVIFSWFSNSVNNASNAIVGQKHIAINTPIKLISLVLSVSLSDLFKQLIVVFVGLLLLKLLTTFSINYFYLLCIIFVQFFFIFSFSLITALIIPLIPDFKLVLSVIVQVMMFSSGVFFSINNIPEQFKSLIILNPLANIIELSRFVIIDNYESPLAISSSISALVITTGILFIVAILFHQLVSDKVRKVL